MHKIKGSQGKSFEISDYIVICVRGLSWLKNNCEFSNLDFD